MKRFWKKTVSLFLAAVITAALLPVAAVRAEETAGVPAGKVFSVMGDSISTFAGYIPVADGFNREHLARYPQDDLLTDVNETWWMQVVAQLDGKLGINDSWRGATVSGAKPVTTGDTGENAAMSNLTRIQNLGSNGTPDVIMFYGGTNDLAHVEKVGTFDPETAPSEVNLTITKWDNLVEAYAHTLLRMRHYYPDAVILAMLPTYTKNYYSNDKLADANAKLALVCEHYGVPYVDLRDSGVTAAHLPDGIHPGAEGMDLITQAVIGALETQCTFEQGENVVYKVSHSLTNTTASLGHYKGISAGSAFTETLAGGDMVVTVTMGGVDITESCYADKTIHIPEVTGDLVITAEARLNLGGRLQQLPEMYYGINLWQLLSHGADYYGASGWTEHASGKVKSVAIPVKPGEKIYASSFGAASVNGSGSTNGIRVTWFTEEGVASSISADTVYKEFSKNGCLTVPEGAAAVCIPMWTDSADWVLTIAVEGTPDPDHDYVDGYCTKCQNVTAGQQHFATVTDALSSGHLWLNRDLAEDVTVTADTYLDLNGYTLTGYVTIADGATLYVFDSATADYTADHRGKLIGTVTGNLAKSFNTPATYGHNYKYLSLKESDDSYSFHRYYLAVKSAVLVPQMRGQGYTGTAVNYKTVFKCSDFVAQYITAYGTKLVGDNTVYADYMEKGYSLLTGADNTNEKSTWLAGSLKSTNTAEVNAANALLAPAVSAYITLSDDTEITSAEVTRSVQDVIAYANGRYNTLTEDQRSALIAMYNQFEDLMSGWDMDVIGNIRAAVNPVDPGSHCICGAVVGQAHTGDCNGEVLTWTPWTSTNSLPLDPGNYYLVNDVRLKERHNLNDNAKNFTEDVVLNIDLNGKTIYGPVGSTNGDRVFVLLSSVGKDIELTITDSSAGRTGLITHPAGRTDKSKQGTLFFLYDNGDANTTTVNIYRATLDASAATGTTGVAIQVENTHTANLYNVTVKGGTASSNGGAIYMSGASTVKAEGCTISAVKASNGGAIAMAGGNLTLADSTVNGAAATNGGAVYMTGGSLTLTDATVSGAKANFGGAIWMGGSTAKVTMEGGLIKGADANGGAVNIADAGGSFTMKASAKGEPVIDATGCTAANYGAAVHLSSCGSVNNSFTMECGKILGGTVTGTGGGGGAVFIQGGNGKVSTFTMNGGTISGGMITDAANTKGGGNIRIGGSGCAFYMNGGTITGGESTNGKGGGLYVSANNTFQIAGNAKITGNVANDLYVQAGTKIIIGADWIGDADNAMVVAMADGTGTFATAATGVTLTEAQKAYFAGNVTLVNNTFVLN